VGSILALSFSDSTEAEQSRVERGVYQLVRIQKRKESMCASSCLREKIDARDKLFIRKMRLAQWGTSSRNALSLLHISVQQL
jgi:hypothetical protein